MNPAAALLAFVAGVNVAACSSGGGKAVAPQDSATPQASAVSNPSATQPMATSVADRQDRIPEPGPDLKIVPMTLDSSAKSFSLELKQDGTVWATDPKATEQVGTISKNHFTTQDGSITISVSRDRTVLVPGARKRLSLDEKDSLVVDGGGGISIDDEGNLDLTKADGTKKAPPSLKGFKPGARRTAIILMVFYSMSADAPVVGAPRPNQQ